MEPGVFECQFVHVLGVKFEDDNKFLFHFRSWKNNLGEFESLNQAASALSPRKFMKTMFHPTIESRSSNQVYLRYLNQISGIFLFAQNNKPFSLVVRDGVIFHEMSSAPDIWNRDNGFLYDSDKKLGLLGGPPKLGEH